VVQLWDFDKEPTAQEDTTLQLSKITCTMNHRSSTTIGIAHKLRTPKSSIAYNSIWSSSGLFEHPSTVFQRYLHGSVTCANRIRGYSFNVFEYQWICNRSVLIIESANGQEASALPQWVRNTRNIVRQHRLLGVECEILRCWTGKVASGDGIGTPASVKHWDWL
jgi:hypothetical protein